MTEHRVPLSRSVLWFTALAMVLLVAACRSFPNHYGLKRGPYLQWVTPDSVWIVWDTVTEQVGQVSYGLSDELGQIVAEVRPARHHSLLLQGLSPYTEYYYRVPDTPVFSFRTAAAPESTSFSFAVIGDTQTYHDTHQAVVQQMIRAQPDWYIHLGDMIEHGESVGQWDDFFGIEAPLMATTPFITTIGNHQRDSANYYDAFQLPGNEHWYSYTYGNARFVCLEGDGYPDGAPVYTKEELAWLENELATRTERWLIVFQHRAVYTSAAEDETELTMRSALAPLFERYGVDLFLSGHKHNYERLLVNGVTYVVSGGGGGKLTRFASLEPGSQKQSLAHHFLLIEVDRDRMACTAIDVDGKIIDQWEIAGRKW